MSGDLYEFDASFFNLSAEVAAVLAFQSLG
jgi:hypothetical protein